MTPGGILRVVAVVVHVAGPLAAQRTELSLDVGAASMRFADSIAARSTSLSPEIRVVGRRGTVMAGGSLSQLEGSWTNSGRIDASLVAFSARRVSGELAGVAGGSSHANGSRTGQVILSARAQVATLNAGVWAGAGGRPNLGRRMARRFPGRSRWLAGARDVDRADHRRADRRRRHHSLHRQLPVAEHGSHRLGA